MNGDVIQEGGRKSRGLGGSHVTKSHVVWGGKPLTSRKKGSRAQGHVIWGGKPLTGWKKGSRAQGTGSHVIWGGKLRTSREKRIAGSWTADRRGLRVQSPIWSPWGGLSEKIKKEDAMLENK